MDRTDPDAVSKLQSELRSTTLSLLDLILQLQHISLVSMNLNTQYQNYVCSRCSSRGEDALPSTVPEVGSSSAVSAQPGSGHQIIPPSLPGDLVEEFMQLPPRLQLFIKAKHARATSHFPISNFQQMPPISEVGERAENIHQQGGTAQNGAGLVRGTPRWLSFKKFFVRRAPR